MTPRAFATILCRFLGLWLIFDAAFRIADLLMRTSNMRAPYSGWTSYPPSAPSTAIEFYFHDTYYVIGHFSVPDLFPSLKLLLGLILLLAARRIARCLCSGAEEP